MMFSIIRQVRSFFAPTIIIIIIIVTILVIVVILTMALLVVVQVNPSSEPALISKKGKTAKASGR